MENLLSYSFSVVLTTFLLYLSLYVLFSLLEAIYPAEKSQSLKGRLRNLYITLSYLTMGVIALSGLKLLFDIPLEQIGQNSMTINIGVILLFILIADFFYYWYHRAQHTLKWLWPIHETHHADTELNVTSSYRTYWLEIPIQAAIVTFPASLILGSPGEILFATAATLIIWEFFTHTNIRLHLGWLSPIICGPQVHRIHHSNQPEHRNKNFAQYFPIYDVIFGTYYAPKKDEFPSTGIKSLAVDAPLFETTFTHPIKVWRKLYRRKN